MSRAFKNYLPSTFRYTNPPNSVTKQQNTADCLILMNMDDHVKVYMILDIYTLTTPDSSKLWILLTAKPDRKKLIKICYSRSQLAQSLRLTLDSNLERRDITTYRNHRFPMVDQPHKGKNLRSTGETLWRLTMNQLVEAFRQANFVWFYKSIWWFALRRKYVEVYLKTLNCTNEMESCKSNWLNWTSSKSVFWCNK